MRRYYLDELPQLWNILKGDMSLVGPRPHVQFEVDHYTPEQRRRLTVKPGCTGLWQVAGKADCTFSELIDLDLKYIDKRSFWFDLYIILKTAALMDTESTGNGARHIFSTPSPSPSNLILEAGKTPLSELLAEIERGLLVEHVLGLGQGNTISGAFSNTLGLAYVIAGGEIVGRVKDVSIAGNVYEDLRAIEAISQETEWVYGGLCLPYILLPELNVVTKG